MGEHALCGCGHPCICKHSLTHSSCPSRPSDFLNSRCIVGRREDQQQAHVHPRLVSMPSINTPLTPSDSGAVDTDAFVDNGCLPHQCVCVLSAQHGHRPAGTHSHPIIKGDVNEEGRARGAPSAISPLWPQGTAQRLPRPDHDRSRSSHALHALVESCLIAKNSFN